MTQKSVPFIQLSSSLSVLHITIFKYSLHKFNANTYERLLNYGFNQLVPLNATQASANADMLTEIYKLHVA